jgi:FkbM family methyltransferase
MRFREGAIGQRILRLPRGEQILSLGKSMVDGYYWFKYKKHRHFAWAVRQSRDSLTRRALVDRLTDDERQAKYVPIHLRCLDGPLLARPFSTDPQVIKEIFGDQIYRPIRGTVFTSVLDCGANGGVFAAYAKAQAGSELRAYVGVEPDPDSFALLTEQVRLRGMAPISTLMEVAVSDQDATANFDTNGNSWTHRLMEGGKLVVQTLTVNSILDRAGLQEVDLMKLDVEGGEKQVLESWPTWCHRVKCVVVELHNFEHPLDFNWFSSLARASGYHPMAAGTLFRGMPGAVREDVRGILNI